MRLQVPRYLRVTNIQDSVIHYEWDDWRTLPSLEIPDEELVARLERVSQRAVLALACGTTEWIVYRYMKLCDCAAPWSYLEAAWAMVIDIRYCGYGSGITWQEYSSKGWDGPVKRPIKEALKLLEIAFQQLASEYHTEPTVFSGLLSTLASHVIRDSASYKRWCAKILDRFEPLYPRNQEDPLGDVIPRQAIDPEIDFHIEQTQTLISEFLSSLDYRSNIFLSSPDGMVQQFEGQEDFKAIPYVFDIEKDRRDRIGE